MPIPAPVCPYCHASAILCDASAVYGPKFEGKFNVWACSAYPECNSFTGAKQGPVPSPTGIMANQELRRLHKRLRDMTPERKPIGRRKRGTLAPTEVKGISFMNDEECRRALRILIERGERENEKS